jgi:hypothetical protein
VLSEDGLLEVASVLAMRRQVKTRVLMVPAS